MTNNKYLLNQNLVAFINTQEKSITIELNNIMIAIFFYDSYEIKKDIFNFTKYELWVYTHSHTSSYSINDYSIIY